SPWPTTPSPAPRGRPGAPASGPTPRTARRPTADRAGLARSEPRAPWPSRGLFPCAGPAGCASFAAGIPASNLPSCPSCLVVRDDFATMEGRKTHWEGTPRPRPAELPVSTIPASLLLVLLGPG